MSERHELRTRRRIRRCAFAAGLFSALLWVQSLFVAVSFRGMHASIGVGGGLLNPNLYESGSVSTGWGVTWPRDLQRRFHAQTWWPAYPLTWRKAHIIAPVNIPLWIPTVCFLALGLALRPRSGPAGRPVCHKCGYDLTGNVSGICPECGTPTEA